MAKYEILIVEDDRKIAYLLKDYFEQEDFKVAMIHRLHQRMVAGQHTVNIGYPAG